MCAAIMQAQKRTQASMWHDFKENLPDGIALLIINLSR
jgi:hypothetical protein